MSVYDDVKKHLKDIYEFCSNEQRWDFAVTRDTYFKLSAAERNTMDMHFEIMEQEGWVEKYAPSIGTPYSYKLTARGIKVAENISELPVVQSNSYTVLNPTNSIIGDNANNNIINAGVSFNDLKALTEQYFSNHTERKEILDTLDSLQDKIKSNQPLEKGFLAKINDKLEGCSWLSSGIAAQLIQYLSTIKQ